MRSTLPLGCGCPRRGFAVFRMVTSPVRNLQRFAMRGLFGKRGITEKPPYVGLTRSVPSCDTFFLRKYILYVDGRQELPTILLEDASSHIVFPCLIIPFGYPPKEWVKSCFASRICPLSDQDCYELYQWASFPAYPCIPDSIINWHLAESVFWEFRHLLSSKK